jgi:ComF family protein
MQYLPRWQPSVIVPVPMHPHKKRIRGYNQAELLACEVSRRTGIPVRTDLVRCVHLTRDQKQLDRKGRMQNLKGSFRMDGTLPAGTAVLLLDDVYTTGSTLDELSSVLRAHGAANIYFVVLCTGKGKNTVCTGEKL